MLPVARLLQLFDFLLIQVLARQIQLGRKDSITTDFEAVKNLLEDNILIVDDVVDQRIADDKIVHTDQLLR